MASITPIVAVQNTEQSTSSTTPVDANCETAALSNGVDYLVKYTGNCGGGATGELPCMRLMFGSTVIAEVCGEGRGLDQHWDGASCSGFRKVTGNGTDTLKFQFWCGLSGDLTYAGAMVIEAMPLDDLTENTDYWHSGTNGSTLEKENASTSWETWRSQAFTLPADGDYLILMSGECNAENSGGGQADSWRARYYVDSTELTPTDTGEGHNQEWEDDADFDSTVSVAIENLSSGSRTFKMECGSRDSATANFRRSNIWVFRKAAFDQMVQTQDTTGNSTTSTSFVPFTGLNTTYTPNQQEYVSILGYMVPGNSSTQTTTTELYNSSDTTEHCIDSAEYNNDNGFDSGRCCVPNLLLHCGQYSTAKNWQVRFRVDGGTGVIGKNRANSAGIESNLIFWGLTTAAAGTTRELAANIAATSVTPSIDATSTRELAANIAATSVTPSISAITTRELSASCAATSVTPDIAATNTRSLLTSITAVSTTPDIDYTITRGLSANVAVTSVIPNISAVTGRALGANVACVSIAPDIIATLTRGIEASIAVISITPDDVVATLGESRELMAAIAAASTTPDIAATITRGLLTNVSPISVTPDIGVITARSIEAQLTAGSQTPDITISIIRDIVASISVATNTPDIAATITRGVAAIIAVTTTTPDIGVLFGRALKTSIAANTITTDIAIQVARDLVAAIDAISFTPDIEITIQMVRELLASIVAVSQTPDIDAIVTRALATNLVATSVTPDITAELTRNLAAQIAVTTVTPDITISFLWSLVANIVATSVTSDAACQNIRNLIASIQANSDTPDVAVLMAIAVVMEALECIYDDRIRSVEYHDESRECDYNDAPLEITV